VRIRYIDDILLLIITNFVVWSWALEKHPELNSWGFYLWDNG